MKRYINNIGCSAEFEDGIPEEEILKRLSWLGSGWILQE